MTVGDGDPGGQPGDDEEGGGGFALIINGHSLVRNPLQEMYMAISAVYQSSISERIA